MSPRLVLGRENVPCVAEVVNRSLRADCTDFNPLASTTDIQFEVKENNFLTSSSGGVMLTTQSLRLGSKRSFDSFPFATTLC